MSMRDFVIL
jgi:NIMA (never in mitosis gene a)-related kinase 1/4/5